MTDFNTIQHNFLIIW